MIYGVGIDLIETDRIRRELMRSGDNFCRELFTEEEIEYCVKSSNITVRSQCLAGRFSAKEAFLKAIGTGLRDQICWHDIEISNDSVGKPYFILRNRAREIIDKEHISNIQLSISHLKNTASAVVILER